MKLSCKCNECGGRLKEVDGEKDTYICEYCGTKQKIESNAKKDEKSKSKLEIKINNILNFGDLEGGYKKPFDIYHSALATLLFIIFNVAFIFLYGLLPVSVRAIEPVYYIASFLVEFLFAVAAFVVSKAYKINLIKEAGMNKKISLKMVGLALLVAIVCMMFFSDLTSVFMQLLYNCGYQSVLSDMQINTFWRYLVYVLITCITPAVCEELLFRGVILSGFKNYGKKIAVVISALIFMLMHGNAEQTVHQFIIGLVLGYIFIETGNLWIGVLIHFFNNFIAVTELYIYSKLPVEEIADSASSAATETVTSPWLSLFVSLIIAIIFAAIGYFIIKRLIKSIKREDEKINSKPVENTETILVDGAETDVSMTVNGEKIENISYEDGKSQTVTTGVDSNGKPQISFVTIALFAVSGLYLLFDWITSLLSGLGVF